MSAITVMFTTYNEPQWLEWVLWGFSVQTVAGFEVLVVDDGSRDDTRAVIDRLRPQMPYRLRHFWQPDEGFQKCKGINRGILLAEGEYLIFTDGDCIPHPEFVARHLALRERGRFLTGGYCKLPMALSKQITREDILAGRATEYAWLAANGLERHTLKLRLKNEALRSLFNTITPVKPLLHGHNASLWKDDAVRVNGYDERMQYGKEDLEFGDRLTHAGVRGKTIRYSAICVHLDHKRGYVTPQMKQKNSDIRACTKRTRATWAEQGIDSHRDEDNRAG